METSIDTWQAWCYCSEIILWKICCSRNKCLFEVLSSLSQISLLQLSLCIIMFELPLRTLISFILMVYSHKCFLEASLGLVSLVYGRVFKPSMTGFDDIIRDHRVSFLCGLCGSIDHCCIIHEILALYHSMNLCWSTGHRYVVCYSNFLHVLYLVWDPLNVFYRFD